VTGCVDFVSWRYDHGVDIIKRMLADIRICFNIKIVQSVTSFLFILEKFMVLCFPFVDQYSRPSYEVT